MGYGTTDPFDSDPIASDVIFEQSENTYDDAGLLTYSLVKRRYDSAATTGGGSQGALTDPSTANRTARITYSAAWYDEIGRPTHAADYGTDNTARPDTAPASSNTVHVTQTTYNDCGEAFRTTDAMGKVYEIAWDQAGRLIRQVNNVVGSPTTYDENQTVEYEYNPDGRVSTLRAVNGATNDQETVYEYDVDGGASEIYSCDLLSQVTYPDSGVVTYEYNRQGQVIKMTDQNGTIHDHEYDGRGRPTADIVSNLGTGIDAAVQRIDRAYEVRGMLNLVTSYDDVAGGALDIVNQVELTYNSFSQLSDDRQSHSGTTGTVSVEYAYEKW